MNIVIIILTFFLCIASSIYAFLPIEVNNSILILVSITAFISYLLSVVALKISSIFSWFGFFNLFNVSYLIATFQFYLLYSYIPEIAEDSGLWIDWNILNRASVLGLVSYLLFLISYIWTIRRNLDRLKPSLVAYLPYTSLKKFSNIGALACWLLFAIFLVVVGPAYLSGAYDGTKNWASGSTYVYILFQISLFIIISIDIYSLRQANKNLSIWGYVFQLNKLTLTLATVFVLFNVYTGERGVIVQVFIIYWGGYAFFFRNISFFWFFMILAVGAAFMTFMAFSRTRDAGMSVEERIESGIHRFQDETKWYSITGHLASSVRINNAAIAFNQNDPMFGRTMLVNIAGVIPFAPSMLTKTYSYTGIGFNSSVYFTNLLSPVSDKGNQTGAGSTIFADVYLNFNIIGIYIFFPLLGFATALIEFNAKNTINIFYHTFYVILLSEAIYWPRSMLFGNLRNFAWALLILYIFYRCMRGRHVLDYPRALE